MTEPRVAVLRASTPFEGGNEVQTITVYADEGLLETVRKGLEACKVVGASQIRFPWSHAAWEKKLEAEADPDCDAFCVLPDALAVALGDEQEAYGISGYELVVFEGGLFYFTCYSKYSDITYETRVMSESDWRGLTRCATSPAVQGGEG